MDIDIYYNIFGGKQKQRQSPSIENWLITL